MTSNALHANGHLGISGAIAAMIGWLLLLFTETQPSLTSAFIISPLLYYILILYGARQTVRRDEGEIMGLLAAFSYIAAAMTTLGGIYFIYGQWSIKPASEIGPLVLITVGSAMIAYRFFANSNASWSESADANSHEPDGMESKKA